MWRRSSWRYVLRMDQRREQLCGHAQKSWKLSLVEGKSPAALLTLPPFLQRSRCGFHSGASLFSTKERFPPPFSPTSSFSVYFPLLAVSQGDSRTRTSRLYFTQFVTANRPTTISLSRTIIYSCRYNNKHLFGYLRLVVAIPVVLIRWHRLTEH